MPNCDTHCSISLLSVAGKILAQIIWKRCNTCSVGVIFPDSPGEFRSGQGTIDMIITAWQLQEKWQEQNPDLYIVFYQLSQSFWFCKLWGSLETFVHLWMSCRAYFCYSVLPWWMMAILMENGEIPDPLQSVMSSDKAMCAGSHSLFHPFFWLCSRMYFITPTEENLFSYALMESCLICNASVLSRKSLIYL